MMRKGAAFTRNGAVLLVMTRHMTKASSCGRLTALLTHHGLRDRIFGDVYGGIVGPVGGGAVVVHLV